MGMRLIRGVYLADTARVLGDVRIEADASVWYGAVVRGDVARVTIGQGTNIQDNVVVHADTDTPNTIGSRVTVGHGAVVHGVSVGDGTLIGIGAVVLGGTRLGSGCLIAAGAVVPPGTEVPDGMVLKGVPGKVVRPVSDQEREYLAWLGPHYVDVAKTHLGGGMKAWGNDEQG